MADSVSVVVQGNVIENRATRELIADPHHEETRKLVA
jgi:ABC-type antimicrobial peptide transport system ATPase subunit